MPTKPTIPAAQKRVIKAEIATTVKNFKKIQRDHATNQKQISTEILKLERRRHRAHKTVERESAKITRRIAILQGRLGI